jgi:hypothetical protein
VAPPPLLLFVFDVFPVDGGFDCAGLETVDEPLEVLLELEVTLEVVVDLVFGLLNS